MLTSLFAPLVADGVVVHVISHSLIPFSKVGLSARTVLSYSLGASDPNLWRLPKLVAFVAAAEIQKGSY